MKRCMAAVAVLVLVISLGACKNGGHDVYEEIYERYNSMESYSAVADVTVKNGTSENNYVTEQLFLAPDMFLMEFSQPETVAGCGFVFRGGEILLKSGQGRDVRLSGLPVEERGVFSVYDFFEEYYKSEDTSVMTDKSDMSEVTVLECFLGGKNENRFSQRLWIDNETFLPIRLETGDINRNPVVTVEFRTFERNCEADQGKFEI